MSAFNLSRSHHRRQVRFGGIYRRVCGCRYGETMCIQHNSYRIVAVYMQLKNMSKYDKLL